MALGEGSQLADDLVGGATADTHDHAFSLDVGTGEVDLIGADFLKAFQSFDNRAVVVDGFPCDIDDDSGIELL